jgi:serine/threonine-protein kinase
MFQWMTSWHPSGRFLAFFEGSSQANFDVMILPIESSEASGWKAAKPTVFLSTPFNKANPEFSPDGRWLAYQSNESGKFEVYVRPFPGPGGKWQISTGGGHFPTWSRTRRELFYRADDQRIMVAGYASEGASFRAEKPQVWSERQLAFRLLARNFDLHPDGQRFAVLKAPEAAEAKRDHVVLISNFFDELPRRRRSERQEHGRHGHAPRLPQDGAGHRDFHRLARWAARLRYNVRTSFSSWRMISGTAISVVMVVRTIRLRCLMNLPVRT